MHLFGSVVMSFGKVGAACCLIQIMIHGGLIWAAEGRNTLQMAVQIQPRASLSLEGTQITFADPADPDHPSLIPSREGVVQLTVKVRANAIKSATLNMLAESDLMVLVVLFLF